MARVVVIGADGLDWRSFLTQAQAAHTPHLSGLAARGCAGWIAASALGEGPAAWTSIATGHPVQVHQVFLGQEAWAAGLRPVGRPSWRTAPVWERLEAAGISTASAGWPATRPGAGAPGAHVDDQYAEAFGQSADAWALPRRCTPAAHREALRGLRVHPEDITGDMLLPFVPRLAGINQDRDVSLPHLATALARVSSVHAAASFLIQETQASAVFVHYPWLERIRAVFAVGAPPPFQQVVAAAWRFLDSLIGRIVALSHSDTLVLFVSPGRQGAPGVIVGAAPGRGRALDFEGADLLDIAPTVLAAFGVHAVDQPGRRIQELVPETPTIAVPEPAPPVFIRADPELTRQLQAAGYPPLAGPPADWWAQANGSLALLLAPHAPEAAATLAERALAVKPEDLSALTAAAQAAILTEAYDALPDLADALDRAAPQSGWGALARAAGLLKSGETQKATPYVLKAGLSHDPQLLLRLGALLLHAAQPSNAERAFAQALKLLPFNAAAEIGLGLVAQHRRDFLQAEHRFGLALKADPGRWAAHLQLAQIYAATGRSDEARRAVTTARRLGAPARVANALLSGANLEVAGLGEATT